MLKAWTGEPFEYRGTTVQVTPRPFTQPHPTLMLGGSSKVGGAPRGALRPAVPAARQPARARGLLLRAVRGVRHAGLLRHAARAHGDDASSPRTPSGVWRDLGQHFFEESSTYAAWQPPGQTSSVHSHATSVEELRAEGIYEVVTPGGARRPR